MLSSIRRILERADDETVSECRRCGTTIGDSAASCPYCGPTDVVDYRIE